MMETPRTEEFTKSGSSYVQMPKEDYMAMIEHIAQLEDIEAVRQAQNLRLEGEESFPLELTKKIIEGEHPVKVYRQYRGLTQTTLSEKSGVNRVYIAEIETGKKPGSIVAIKSLADALGIDLDELVL